MDLLKEQGHFSLRMIQNKSKKNEKNREKMINYYRRFEYNKSRSYACHRNKCFFSQYWNDE